ncbi:hypothetical protein LTR17_018773 [Elasticomyces elasticus]|nr:hypothetical protein LTR17_018773 [Elasticomyces elasticus]
MAPGKANLVFQSRVAPLEGLQEYRADLLHTLNLDDQTRKTLKDFKYDGTRESSRKLFKAHANVEKSARQNLQRQQKHNILNIARTEEISDELVKEGSLKDWAKDVLSRDNSVAMQEEVEDTQERLKALMSKLGLHGPASGPGASVKLPSDEKYGVISRIVGAPVAPGGYSHEQLFDVIERLQNTNVDQYEHKIEQLDAENDQLKADVEEKDGSIAELFEQITELTSAKELANEGEKAAKEAEAKAVKEKDEANHAHWATEHHLREAREALKRAEGGISEEAGNYEELEEAYDQKVRELDEERQLITQLQEQIEESALGKAELLWNDKSKILTEQKTVAEEKVAKWKERNKSLRLTVAILISSANSEAYANAKGEVYADEYLELGLLDLVNANFTNLSMRVPVPRKLHFITDLPTSPILRNQFHPDKFSWFYFLASHAREEELEPHLMAIIQDFLDGLCNTQQLACVNAYLRLVLEKSGDSLLLAFAASLYTQSLTLMDDPKANDLLLQEPYEVAHKLLTAKGPLVCTSALRLFKCLLGSTAFNFNNLAQDMDLPSDFTLDGIDLNAAVSRSIPSLLWSIFGEHYLKAANYGKQLKRPEKLWLLRIEGQDGAYAVVYRELGQSWLGSTLGDTELIFIQHAETTEMVECSRVDGDYDVKILIKKHPSRKNTSQSFVLLGGVEFGPTSDNVLTDAYFSKSFYKAQTSQAQVNYYTSGLLS